MSTNTGRAPSWRTGAAVAMKLKEGRRTSWPGFRSRARSPSSRAAVPEFTAVACGTPRYAANSRSNSAFSGPLTNRPLSSTRIAAWRMAASTGISVSGTFIRRRRNRSVLLKPFRREAGSRLEVLHEELRDCVVAPHSVLHLEDVVSLVLEHEVIDLLPLGAQGLDD